MNDRTTLALHEILRDHQLISEERLFLRPAEEQQRLALASKQAECLIDTTKDEIDSFDDGCDFAYEETLARNSTDQSAWSSGYADGITEARHDFSGDSTAILRQDGSRLQRFGGAHTSPRLFMEDQQVKETWQTIQDEQREWSLQNFGEQSPSIPLLGMIEELGELSTAAPADAIDAIGDTIIYLSDYCTRRGLSLYDVVQQAVTVKQPSYRSLIGHLGTLCHAYVKIEQGIRSNEKLQEQEVQALSDIVGWLKGLVDDDLSFLLAVEGTWSQVKNRDWKQNPETGT